MNLEFQCGVLAAQCSIVVLTFRGTNCGREGEVGVFELSAVASSDEYSSKKKSVVLLLLSVVKIEDKTQILDTSWRILLYFSVFKARSSCWISEHSVVLLLSLELSPEQIWSSICWSEKV